MSIGEVAERCGLQPSAIRYYESVGIIAKPERMHGQRRYTEDVLTKLAVIRMAQQAGFSIAEIETLFNGFEPDTPAAERWQALAGEKVREIDALILRAQRMRSVLKESLRCGCLTLDQCADLGWSDAES